MLFEEPSSAAAVVEGVGPTLDRSILVEREERETRRSGTRADIAPSIAPTEVERQLGSERGERLAQRWPVRVGVDLAGAAVPQRTVKAGSDAEGDDPPPVKIEMPPGLEPYTDRGRHPGIVAAGKREVDVLLVGDERPSQVGHEPPNRFSLLGERVRREGEQPQCRQQCRQSNRAVHAAKYRG